MAKEREKQERQQKLQEQQHKLLEQEQQDKELDVWVKGVASRAWTGISRADGNFVFMDLYTGQSQKQVEATLINQQWRQSTSIFRCQSDAESIYEHLPSVECTSEVVPKTLWYKFVFLSDSLFRMEYHFPPKRQVYDWYRDMLVKSYGNPDEIDLWPPDVPNRDAHAKMFLWHSRLCSSGSIAKRSCRKVELSPSEAEGVVTINDDQVLRLAEEKKDVNPIGPGDRTNPAVRKKYATSVAGELRAQILRLSSDPSLVKLSVRATMNNSDNLVIETNTIALPRDMVSLLSLSRFNSRAYAAGYNGIQFSDGTIVCNAYLRATGAYPSYCATINELGYENRVIYEWPNAIVVEDK